MDDVSELVKSLPSEHLDADGSGARTKTTAAAGHPRKRRSISVDFYTPSDPAWPDRLGGVRADFYYLPGYVRLAAAEEGGEPLLFVARDGDSLWLLPLIVRPLPTRLGTSGLHDAVSPYGYSGPLMHVADGIDPAEWSSRAVMALRTALAQSGIVSLFVRLQPLRPQPLDALAGQAISCVTARRSSSTSPNPQQNSGGRPASAVTSIFGHRNGKASSSRWIPALPG